MLTDAQLSRLVENFNATVLARESIVRLRAPRHDDPVSEIRGGGYGEISARIRRALAGNCLDESQRQSPEARSQAQKATRDVESGAQARRDEVASKAC